MRPRGGRAASSSRAAAANAAAISADLPASRARARPARRRPGGLRVPRRARASRRSCTERAASGVGEVARSPLAAPRAARPRPAPARSGRARRGSCSRTAVIVERELGDAAPLAEVDPVPATRSRAACGPSYCQLTMREVVRAGRPRCGPGPARARARAPGACPRAPCRSPREQRATPRVAERARRLGQAELRGERERPLGGRDRLPVGCAADVTRPRQLRVGGDELGAGRLRLEQRERLRERLLAAWIAEAR